MRHSLRDEDPEERIALISRLAIPFSLITLLVIGFVRANPQDERLIEEYHLRVANEINSIPVDFEGWVGQQVPLPQSAISLLRPNALVARRYINEDKGVVATLMIVQCRDARDMGGHYPPVCYPANGWLELEENPQWDYTLEGQDLRVYGFHRVAGRVEREITIYSLFALPTGEVTNSMRDVRKLSANYEYRKYGAAQFQVMINGEVEQDDHEWILEDMYKVARPVIEAVIDAQLEPAHGKGNDS